MENEVEIAVKYHKNQLGYGILANPLGITLFIKSPKIIRISDEPPATFFRQDLKMVYTIYDKKFGCEIEGNYQLLIKINDYLDNKPDIINENSTYFKSLKYAMKIVVEEMVNYGNLEAISNNLTNGVTSIQFQQVSDEKLVELLRKISFSTYHSE